ncbi:uncharacterized protein BKA78DRAFT_121645 [Phyllosticta capitalensis]|uniref:uncharacterized protein n=1 Tax=Phyllosticta capitalensis TaxID=121624 RepID=UPI00312DC096
MTEKRPLRHVNTLAACCVPRPWLGCFAPVECPGSRPDMVDTWKACEMTPNQMLGLLLCLPIHVSHLFLPCCGRAAPPRIFTPSGPRLLPRGSLYCSPEAHPLARVPLNLSRPLIGRRLEIRRCRIDGEEKKQLDVNPTVDWRSRTTSSSNCSQYCPVTNRADLHPLHPTSLCTLKRFGDNFLAMTSPASSARLVYLKPRPTRLSRHSPKT